MAYFSKLLFILAGFLFLAPIKSYAVQISVIMANYNNAPRLERAIESILKQTFQDFELLICDDGSTDNSLKIIVQYALKDSRIKVFVNKKNQGISFTRNRLLNVASGKYLAIMDSDDYSEPTRFEKQVAYLNKHADTTVVGTYAGIIGYNNNVSFENKEGETGINLIFYCAVADGSSMFRRDFINQHQLRYDETILAGMDYRLWGEILMKGGRFHTIPERLYSLHLHYSHSNKYYQDQGDVSHQTSEKLQRFFFDYNEETKNASLCQKEQWIFETNKNLKLFDDNVLQRRIQEHCSVTQDKENKQ